MKRVLLLLVLRIAIIPAFSQSVTMLIGASPEQDSLWVIDTTHFDVIRKMEPFPNSGGVFTGITGIAKNPNSGSIYVIAKQSGAPNRVLGKFNVNTGEVTIIGDLGDRFSSLTFRGDSLYGETGEGAAVRKTMYLIDTLDATKTLLTPFGHGSDGEIICYNPDDGMIYHWTGSGTPIYEKILPYPPYTLTGIPNSTLTSEIFGAVYSGKGIFLTSNINARFDKFDVSGNVTPVSSSVYRNLRGMVYITCDRVLTGASGFCKGDSVTLTASPNANSYQWYLNDLPILDQNAFSLVVKQPGWYNCKISDACGTDTLQGINVRENSIPVVTLNGEQAFCTGDSALLTGTSGGTSQWYLNKIAIPKAKSDSLYAKEPGNYNMIKTNLNGCADSSSTGLIVHENAFPVVEITGDNEACFGDTSILTGTSGDLYQWYMNGVPVEGATSDTLVVTMSGVYNMQLRDANGCSDSSSLGKNVVIAGPVDVSVSLDNGTISASNTQADSYEWYSCSDSVKIAGETNSSFTPGVAGSYFVKITEGACYGTSECSDIITGVPANSLSQMNIYPNPVNDKLNIDVAPNHVLSLEITELSGRIIFKSVRVVSNQTIDLSEYKKGIYIINIKTDKGDLTTKILKE